LLPAAMLASSVLGGCRLASLPSQQNPTCSWESDLPSNADAVCTRTVHVLQSLATAVAHGDIATIRRYVVDRSTVARMTVYSQTVRAEHAYGIHVVPSIGLDREANGRIGAGFYVLGKTATQKLNSQETLYFNWVDGRWVVVNSDLDKNW
jgi:hypothetical protein